MKISMKTLKKREVKSLTIKQKTMKTRGLVKLIYAGMLLVAVSCGEMSEADGSQYQQQNDYVMESAESSEEGYMDSTSDGLAAEMEAPQEDFNTEEYDYIPENDFLSPGVNPLSTFSIDVDNASYTNVRRMLNQGQQPPVDAVRSEEFINYFDYDYPVPSKEDVFSVYTEVAACPWNEENQLLHIGLKGYTVPIEELAPSNLVFLIDVSGSMGADNKLPLLKKSFKLMVDRLNEQDRVSIVTYAGEERLVLEATSCENKVLIKEAIDHLDSEGSTNGEGGIEMAYAQAQKGFIKGGNNRIILATDGDFNIGRSSGGELTRLIESKRDMGVYLTILGFGMGNYKDARMESLTNHGNGNYFYIDEISESHHVLVKNLAGTLMTIAKDVKIQVEFNPNTVAEYRLIGYENRLMNAEDFEDDKKDAGELGAGHTVTAIYEIVSGKASDGNLKYQNQSRNGSTDLGTVKLRFKRPNETKSEYREISVLPSKKDWKEASKDFRFSASVAAFSMLLRSSQYMNDFEWEEVSAMAKKATDMQEIDRLEFIGLIEKAALLQ